MTAMADAITMSSGEADNTNIAAPGTTGPQHREAKQGDE